VPLAAPRRGAALAAITLLVLAADQLTKAWAWRSDGLVHINSGSGLLFGDRAGEVYRDGHWGSLIDVGALAAIVLLGAGLARLRLPRPAFVGSALMLAGWASNLGDRIGLHELTAPGSERGVVDFVRFDGRLWNLADLTIIAGAALCLLAILPLAVRPRRSLPSNSWSTASTASSPAWGPPAAPGSSPASGPIARSERSRT
jgi:lipoprotein signal peptidase